MKLTKQRKENQAVHDAELVQQYRNSHNLIYVGELYSRYSPLVLGLCMKYMKDLDESKDCVSGIFEKVIVELKRHDVTHFKSWLYILSKNFCLMELRKKGKNEVPVSQLNGFLTDFMENDDDDDPNTKEDREILKKKLILGINDLKADQKKCVELFYFEGMSYLDIAENTEYDLNKVKSHLQNAKRNLKILLSQ